MTREVYNTKIVQYSSNTFEIIHYRNPKIRRLGENGIKDTTPSCKKPSYDELYQQFNNLIESKDESVTIYYVMISIYFGH